MHRSALPVLALFSALVAGCVPGLEDPSRFEDFADCPDVQPALLWSRCALSGCHTPSDPTGGLDFLTDGLAERLVDVPSTTCPGELVVDSLDPDASFLLRRVSPDPACGDEPISRMPLIGGHLDDAELDCLRAWVHRLARDAGGARLDAADGGL
jgi:hypothetical protein